MPATALSPDQIERLRDTAIGFGRCLDEMDCLTIAFNAMREHSDDDDRGRFEDVVWEPACDRHNVAEKAFLGELTKADIAGVVVAGRIYVAEGGGLAANSDHYSSSVYGFDRTEIIDLDRPHPTL